MNFPIDESKYLSKDDLNTAVVSGGRFRRFFHMLFADSADDIQLSFRVGDGQSLKGRQVPRRRGL